MTIRMDTIKGLGLKVGDRFDFHGMAKDLPTVGGTRVELSKLGNRYMLTTVTGEVYTWEFGATAKIHASTEDKHAVTVVPRTLGNGDIVYVAKCEHGWETGFHTSPDDASAVAEGHGTVSRPLYVAPVAIAFPGTGSADDQPLPFRTASKHKSTKSFRARRNG